MPINIKRRSCSSFGKVFDICLYSFLIFLDNNLIVYTKLKRWLHYFNYNLYLIKKFN